MSQSLSWIFSYTMGLRNFVSYYFTRTPAGKPENGHSRIEQADGNGQGAEEMRRSSEALRAELDAVRAAKASAEKRLEEEDKAKKALQQDLEQKKLESIRLADRVRILEEQVKRRDAELKKTKTEVDKHVPAPSAQQKAGKVQASSGSSSDEAKVADHFLATPDCVPEKDVIQLVQDLNAEIHQVSQLIADSYKYAEHTIDPSQHGAAAREWAEHALGRPMTQLLQDTDDATIVQVAFQGTMSMYAHWTVRCWYFDLSKEAEIIGDIYDDVYYHMRETEALAVARRWRSLTRKHIQSVVHGDGDIATSLVPRIAERLTDILLVAGCKAPLKQITETMKNKFMDKIKGVITLALKVNKTIGQEILSGDYEVTWVSPEEAYDPTWMDDIDTEHEADKAESEDLIRVLSTTELGLGRMERVTSADGVEEWKDTCLVKPKVVLESMVEWDGEK